MKAVFFRTALDGEAITLVSKYHYAPFPNGEVLWFGAEQDGALIAVAGFRPFSDKQEINVLEFVCFAKDPMKTLQVSQLIAFCCKKLRQAGNHIILTFCEDDHGDGAAFRGSTWLYDGRRERSLTEFRLDGERSAKGKYHIYWKPLTALGILHGKILELVSKPYPLPRKLYLLKD